MIFDYNLIISQILLSWAIFSYLQARMGKENLFKKKGYKIEFIVEKEEEFAISSKIGENE